MVQHKTAQVDGLSVFYREAGEALASATLLKRLPTISDVTETAAFLASDRARAMTATVANLTSGALVD
jgi:enoyl-[acyl-carrier-protein] reductase (NADH)